MKTVKTSRGKKSLDIKITAITKQKVELYASLTIDSQGKNYVYMKASKKGKHPEGWYIPFSSVSELKTLQGVINKIIEETESRKKWLNENK